MNFRKGFLLDASLCIGTLHLLELLASFHKIPSTAMTFMSTSTPGFIAGTLISKTEVPAFIPRQDLMDQLLRWARNEATDPDTIGKYGLPIKVEPYANRDGMLWGITVSILRDGALATEVGIRYDEEEVLKHDWVGRGADGFPHPGG